MKKLIAIAFALFATSVSAAEITGAGATFPFPVYSKWADAYKTATGNRVNYQSVGSGAGIKQIQAKTVTFGASDMPLSDKDLNKDGLFQFPTVIGGNVIAINVEGVKSGELNLDGPTIADIYLGKIKKWDHPSIAKLNPSAKLPNTDISVIRRSDGSGTTFIFSKYLSSVSKEWADKVGTGTALEWPVGVGAKGNEGVAGNVAQTKNSIGYVEYAFAKQNNLAVTKINGVLPSKQTFQTNEWPITAPTYIIMYKKAFNEESQKEAFKFFKWAYENGDKIADELDYVPISAEEKSKIIKGFSL
jgi:phosphate transport system substrate-binding protein